MASKSVKFSTESELIQQANVLEQQLLKLLDYLKKDKILAAEPLQKISKTIENFSLSYITQNKSKLNKPALARLAKRAKKLQQYKTAINYFNSHRSTFKSEAIECYLSLKSIIEKPVTIKNKITQPKKPNIPNHTSDLFYLDLLEIGKIKLAKILTELKFFEAHTPFSLFMPQFNSTQDVHKTLQPFQDRVKYIENLNDIKQDLKKLKLALENIPESEEILDHIGRLLTRISHLKAEYSRMPLLLKKPVLMAPVFPRPRQRVIL